MEVLDKKTMQIFERILNVSNSINKLYKNLYDLELDGKKDSDLYKRNMEYLKLSIEVEEEIYEKIIYNQEKVELLSMYIDEKYNLYDCNSYFDYVYFNQDERGILRVSETLYDVLDNADYSFDNLYEDEDYEVLYSSYFSKLNNMLNKEMIMNYLKENEQQIKFTNEEKDQKDLLTGFKYNASFINKQLEMQLINNDFNIENLYDIDARNNASSLKISYHDYLSVRKLYVTNVLAEQIGNLNVFNDYDLLISFNQQKRSLNCYSIIANINMLDANSVLDIQQLLDEVKEDEPLSNSVNNIIVVLNQYLNERFTYLKENNRKIKVLKKDIKKQKLDWKISFFLL